MKHVPARKRKASSVMVTVVVYKPRQQEYSLVVMPVGELQDMVNLALAGYSAAERKVAHVVTILQGEVKAFEPYEREVCSSGASS